MKNLKHSSNGYLIGWFVSVVVHTQELAQEMHPIISNVWKMP